MSINRLNVQTVILGGGLTGLSAAWHLNRQDCLLLEKEDRLGGLANTDNLDGFRFDLGSHVWFTKDEYADCFVKELQDVRLLSHERSAWVHIHDQLVPAPFQANLFGLPLPVVSECLVGYIEAVKDCSQRIDNFADWLRGSFGEGIYREFMRPYNTKIWTVPPEELSTDWQGTRVDIPKARELVDGAIGLRSNALGMNARFGYPEHGGIGAIAAAVARECPNMMCGAQISSLDLRAKTVLLSDGRKIGYDSLISTIPLPVLVSLLPDAPGRIIEAASALRSTQVLLVNIALMSRPDHNRHWIYFAEPEFPFYRIHFPHNYSTSMCPDGCGAIQAECAFPSGTMVDVEQAEAEVRTRLVDAGYLDPAEVLFTHTRMINPAYVLYDHSRRANVQILLSYLDENDVYCCGRFGAWEYLNMDGCIIAGKEATDRVTSRKNVKVHSIS